MRFNPPSTGLASGVIFLAASFWGLYWIPLRYLEGVGVHGVWSIVILKIPAACALLIFVLCTWRVQREYLNRALLIGIFAGFSIALYAGGLVYSSVVRATMIFYLTPIWGTLIGVFWLGERANWQRWMAIVFGLGGLALLLSGGGSIPLNIGDIFALVGGVVWAVTASMIVRFKGVPVTGMVMFQFFATAVAAILLTVLVDDPALPALDDVMNAMPYAALMSVFIFIPTVCLVFWAQKFLFPGRAGLLMMSEVMLAVISASILLPEERLSLTEWAGAGLVITACLIEVLLTPQEQSKPA